MLQAHLGGVKDNWLRLLHRTYSRSGQWGRSILRRIKPMGWGLMMVTILTAILGTDVPTSATYIYFCGAVALLAVGFGWFLFRRVRLVAVRKLPSFASVGVEVKFGLEVTNVGRFTARAFELEEWPPDPRPTWEEFARQPEPGEQLRNIVDRVLLFYRWTWLRDLKRGFDPLPGESIERLKKQESIRVSFSLTPVRRGLLELADLRALLPDPLGLFQRCARVATPIDHLVVLPKRYPLGDFAMPGQARLHLGGEAAANTVGPTGDFLNLRDYRPGDPFRSVDWKSWARLGYPVVREYEDNFFPRYGLVLDTSGPSCQALEEAISVAASFVASIDSRECLLDLMFVRGEAIRATAGRGLARPSKLLRALATIEADGSMDLDALGSLVARHREELTACLVIFPGWNDVRAEFYRQMLASNTLLEALVIVRPNEDTENWPRSLHLLHMEKISEDLIRATSRFSTS